MWFVCSCPKSSLRRKRIYKYASFNPKPAGKEAGIRLRDQVQTFNFDIIMSDVRTTMQRRLKEDSCTMLQKTMRKMLKTQYIIPLRNNIKRQHSCEMRWNETKRESWLNHPVIKGPKHMTTIFWVWALPTAACWFSLNSPRSLFFVLCFSSFDVGSSYH